MLELKPYTKYEGKKELEMMMINLLLGSSWRPPILCLTRILKPTGEPGRFQGFVGEYTSILLDPRSMAF